LRSLITFFELSGVSIPGSRFQRNTPKEYEHGFSSPLASSVDVRRRRFRAARWSSHETKTKYFIQLAPPVHAIPAHQQVRERFFSCRSPAPSNFATSSPSAFIVLNIGCTGNQLNTIINASSLQEAAALFALPVPIKTRIDVYSASCEPQNSSVTTIEGVRSVCTTFGKKRSTESAQIDTYYPYFYDTCNQTHHITRYCNQSDCTDCVQEEYRTF
jgi:hypothetical protein